MAASLSKAEIEVMFSNLVASTVAKLESADASIKSAGEITGKELERIAHILDYITGNGSGRKGVLERMQEDMEEEKEKQQSFRYDIREQLSAMTLSIAKKDIKEKILSEEKDKERDWLKWILGGIGIVVWKLIQQFIINPHLGKH